MNKRGPAQEIESIARFFCSQDGEECIASLVFVRRNERRLEEEAEHAFPGPLDASSPLSRGAQDQGQEASLRCDTQVD